MFKFTKIYYEKDVNNYKLGKYLLDKYKDLEQVEIDNHNNILELRKRENKDFPVMKTYLIIGVRKTQKFVTNYKVSNFLVPYTSSGCSAYCLYCYLVANYNKCAYLRLFVNIEELLDKIIKTSNKSNEELVFEIGSNSDLILENTITNNLKYTIETFGKNNHGYITFPTKFHYVDSILNLKHNGKTIIRVSMNPNEIIKKIELKTSQLNDRINAINKLKHAGYKVGILIAPIILVSNYKKLYKELIIKLSNELSNEVKKDVFFEVIFMTYSFIHRRINEEAFPNSINLYDKDLMKNRGMGKYIYKDEYKKEGEEYIKSLINEYFPSNNIIYVC